MSTALSVRFLAGRFHATPWGRHVNEDAPEWPPAPWRILRALVAAWKGRPGPEDDDGAIGAVLEKLSPAPAYALPPAAVGHSRHYMPLFDGKRTLVFDKFVVVDPGTPLVIVWPDVVLTRSEGLALDGVLARLTYLGRAESWCEVKRVALPAAVDCMTLDDGSVRPDSDTVRLLGACIPVALETLAITTTELHEKRMSLPVGARWLTYSRPRGALEARSDLRQPCEVQTRGVTVARYALDGSVLPLLGDTLAVGEMARRALIARHRAPSATFSGKDPEGRRLDGHRHAFFLPTDEDRDGRLDHLTVFARGVEGPGYTASEMAAIDGFRTLRQLGGRPDLRLLLLGTGEPGDFDAPALATATEWRSATPFVPPRHRKERGRNLGRGGPAEQLVEELSRRGLPAPVHIEPLERCPLDGRDLRWIEFRRERIFGDGSRGGALGYGFRIRFAEPIRGPIALGYGCHFGLGLFVAVS